MERMSSPRLARPSWVPICCPRLTLPLPPASRLPLRGTTGSHPPTNGNTQKKRGWFSVRPWNYLLNRRITDTHLIPMMQAFWLYPGECEKIFYSGGPTNCCRICTLMLGEPICASQTHWPSESDSAKHKRAVNSWSRRCFGGNVF